MDKQIREFLEYIELERGHSQLTIRNYESYLTKFAEFAEGQGIKDVSKIDLELIKKWRLALHRRKLSIKTLNYYMIALRSFLKYLSKTDVESLVPEKIELADTPDREIKFLEEEELKRLLETNTGKNDKELRDRAILEVLFSTGVRVSELVALNRDQINLERGEFSVLGKGGKARVVFLSDSAVEWLDKYLRTRFDQAEPLFVSLKLKVKSEKLKVTQQKGQVIAIEKIPELAKFGETNIAKYNYIEHGIVKVLCADGSKGLPQEAPFDKILASASALNLPKELVEQLKNGGTLVIPISTSIFKITKDKQGKISTEEYPGFVFVPLITENS